MLISTTDLRQRWAIGSGITAQLTNSVAAAQAQGATVPPELLVFITIATHLSIIAAAAIKQIENEPADTPDKAVRPIKDSKLEVPGG